MLDVEAPLRPLCDGRVVGDDDGGVLAAVAELPQTLGNWSMAA